MRASFYEAPRFKANSTLHEQTAERAGLAFVTQEALLREQPFLPLNTGRAQGRLRIIKSVEQTGDLSPQDILVLDEVPVWLPPVAGLVTQRPSTLLSHVNLLAKGWGIPNAYVRDAQAALRQYDGQWVELNVNAQDYRVQPMARPTSSPRHAAQTGRAQAAQAGPVGDRAETAVRPESPRQPLLWCQGRQSGRAQSPPCRPPPACRTASACPSRNTRPSCDACRWRRRSQRWNNATIPDRRQRATRSLSGAAGRSPAPSRTRRWRNHWRSGTASSRGQGVFVRSSSNSEDLPGFSGAGLYTTVPNVTQAEALARAAEPCGPRSTTSRPMRRAARGGRLSRDVAMAVLVQLAAPSDSSGVMITRDPFDAGRRHVTYISAKRGLGIRWWKEGKRRAEQVMYSSWSKAVQVLSRSAEDTQLVPDAAGGVRECCRCKARARY